MTLAVPLRLLPLAHNTSSSITSGKVTYQDYEQLLT